MVGSSCRFSHSALRDLWQARAARRCPVVEGIRANMLVSAAETLASATARSEIEFPRVGDWFVLHVKSRQEKALAADLDALQIGFFLPLVEQVRFYGRRKAVVEAPLFGSYLFLRGRVEHAYQAERTRRVAQIISVADQAKLDQELTNLHLALARHATLDPYPYLVVGTRVEVRAGPFRGLQGVVDARRSASRLILAVQMLGRAVSLEVDGSLLDVIGATSR